MFGTKKGLTMFCFLEPALEAFDMDLQVSTKLLERADLLVRLSEMLAQDGENFLFWLSSTRVSEIEVDDVMDFIQAESKLLKLVNFAQTGKRLLAVVVLAVAFTLTWRDQPNAFVVANGAWSYPSSFCQIAY